MITTIAFMLVLSIGQQPCFYTATE